MTPPSPARFLYPAPSIAWVTDRRCTLVVNEAEGAVFQLTGLSEVVWDCLVQGFSYVKIVRMVAEMRGATPDSAGEMVEAMLREWRDLGLVRVGEPEETHG